MSQLPLDFGNDVIDGEQYGQDDDAEYPAHDNDGGFNV